MRRLFLPVLLAPLLLVGGAGTALAFDQDQVVAALRASPVYQAPGLDLVDVPLLVSELTTDAPRVVVAVLRAEAAASDAAARSQAVGIGEHLLETDLVVLVVTENGHYGAATGHAAVLRGVDGRAALTAELAGLRETPMTRDAVTALVTSFAQRVAGQAARDRSVPPQDSGDSRALLLLAALAVGAVLLVVRAHRRRPPTRDLGVDLGGGDLS